ncbi:YeiH family protein [Novosphingobium mangrovi (ex Huang et al. 2023)]|uniref:YeiH family protein n=1 Tax=Novosphingobium mangrovi (ex Huang et al. 2023) TaxID=2976432 RepID=A0ABT2I1R2_9SPHN|nr:YeiH family protein [Novosphingobium mangrovi (ex Huang et al. 2023)]MCT2398733.1 YeiH family protein [Novosphingobium mangrovi (ex Huang et al. 2023)]
MPAANDIRSAPCDQMLGDTSRGTAASCLASLAGQGRRLLPGIGLCVVVTLAAEVASRAEEAIFGQAWIEPLVLAILIGTAVRTVWTPSARWFPGIGFSAKLLLEIAVVLLGLSVSAATIMAAGPALLACIAAIVFVAIGISFGVGRMLGLSKRMAILVACGNSICGNSAIAAVAPVIGADGDDVAASIAFTAVLGVAVVLGLPLIGHALDMSALGYGALAGLTVYAVPQVLAAATPFGSVAIQMGTLVKLVRVLMLGPVCLVLAMVTPGLREETDEPAPHVTAGERPARGRPPIHHLVPWFIIGFLVLVAFRSFGWVPQVLLAPASTAATLLTIVSMAALGLGVDVRTVARAGGRVTVTVIASLLALGGISMVMLGWLGLS